MTYLGKVFPKENTLWWRWATKYFDKVVGLILNI
jgi:hypothetical protein